MTLADQVARRRCEAAPGPGGVDRADPASRLLGPPSAGLVHPVVLDRLGLVAELDQGRGDLLGHDVGEAEPGPPVDHPQFLGQAEGAERRPGLVLQLALAGGVRDVRPVAEHHGATADPVEPPRGHQHVVGRLHVRSLDPVGHRVHGPRAQLGGTEHVPVAVRVVLQEGRGTSARRARTDPASRRSSTHREPSGTPGPSAPSAPGPRSRRRRAHRAAGQLVGARRVGVRGGSDPGREDAEPAGSTRVLDHHQVAAVDDPVRTRRLLGVVPASVGGEHRVAGCLVQVHRSGLVASPIACIRPWLADDLIV